MRRKIFGESAIFIRWLNQKLIARLLGMLEVVGISLEAGREICGMWPSSAEAFAATLTVAIGAELEGVGASRPEAVSGSWVGAWPRWANWPEIGGTRRTKLK